MQTGHWSDQNRETGRVGLGVDSQVLLPDLIRPSQFNQIWGASRVRSGEQCLALAVLEQAANDLEKYRHARRRRPQRLYMEAYNWVASDSQSWPYSFVNICESVGLSVEALRARLLGCGDTVQKRLAKAA